ncbi:MAG: hypothetical protein KDB93_09795, partial [Flavobacteriales bacterium]|nr:hypothetical protein [Flavobacteriales bacterium]
MTLDLFYDCTGVAALPQDIAYASACGSGTVTVAAPVPVEVSQICASQIANSTCNGGGLQGVHHYSFQTVLNLPPCPGGWTLSWVTCCRAATLNLVGSPGTYLEATLRNDLVPCGDSPQFSDFSVPYVCVGQQFDMNFGVSVPTGQYTTYTLVGSLGFMNGPNPIAYKPGFSPAQPVPGTMLNATTGQLTFTPPAIGKYVFVVQVDQYDANGVLIGSVMRDIMLVSMACTGSAPAPQGPAQLTGPAGPGDPPGPNVLLTGVNAIEVCDGMPVCFSIGFEDQDAADVLAISSQAATLMPGSTVSITGTNPSMVTVCWTGDINYSPVNLLFQVNDGACPIMNTASVGIIITSVSPLPGIPDPGTNSSAQICPTAAPFDLIDYLGGNPNTTGSWTGPGGNPHGPQFDPALDPVGTYTYTVGNACASASATLTISFTSGTPDAGTDGTLNVCGNGSAVALISGLGGTPDLTGTWSGPSVVVGGLFDPVTMDPGAYSYTVPAGGGCAAASATVTVTEQAAP